MSNPEFHTCYRCGYQWRHGQHGGHDCIGRVEVQRNELLTAMNGLLAYFESGYSVATGKAVIKTDSLEVRAAYAAIAKTEGGAA